ncbi:DUF2238 domain-containing protein [Cronobacter muytjensii]|uniref:DUF2238 domain-containing protein n=1 Tax=Cronobacter muytjensii TaxID=413501 RepID=UPI001375A389|nr:DUF2238 domain-containing protein [Cronobacter muytjensii]EGT4338138.1 hypothetical protein [Cronobacter muytjensii]EKS1843453.1 DUF2238 domain-containing protein [Cronobacter muytjensii]ELY4518842.1 DUF2238 domain-containing protein [Cronobacter muytjensii]ELY6343953.1 DUF2238 domain-containing protein [Cronobacter muytjensii]MDI6454788.1 DUF2238 domain-containing protein [Cronobacter muytjensii]
MKTSRPFYLTAGVALLALLLVITALTTGRRLTWLMEVMPVLIVAPVLWVTAKRYPLTPLLYTLIFLGCASLIVGGMYSYARVPIGFAVQEWFGLARNPYDRFGHVLQGLVISMAAREVLARGGYRLGAKMLACLVCCVTLAISAFYELIEWWVALALGKDADDFLGTQGDEWDTQADMLCALVGAFISVFVLGRWHTRQLRRFLR